MRRLPKNVHFEPSRHGQPRYYFRLGNGERIRLPDNPKDPDFKRAIQVARDMGISIPRKAPSTAEDRHRQRVAAAMERLVKGARARAKKRAMEFDLDLEWAIAQVEAQRMRCKLTNLPFFMEPPAGTKISPYAPSLDRIDCRRGYTKDNVRIVVYALNVMLMDWGEVVFSRVAASYRYASQQRKANAYSLTMGYGAGRKSETIGASNA